MDTVRWNRPLETLLRELADESQILASLHQKSHEYFAAKNKKYQLPIIILSVISGSGNFVSNSFPDEQEVIILGIGVLSICTSIISSVSQYLKLSEYSEAHRIASVSWEKFYQTIRFQLIRRRQDRTDLSEYMTMVTNEYQRMKETSPIIPKDMRKSIKKKRKRLGNMWLPFLAGGGLRQTEMWCSHRDVLMQAKDGGADLDSSASLSSVVIPSSTTDSVTVEAEDEPTPVFDHQPSIVIHQPSLRKKAESDTLSLQSVRSVQSETSENDNVRETMV